MNPFFDPQMDITPQEAARRMQEEGLLLIDVREQYEWDAGRVPGSHHIEIERIASTAPAIPNDRPVAFMCLGGTRSGMVAKAFRASGYDAYNVAGGFNAWFNSGLPTEPDDATIAPH
ncbi:MAG: rhodanese-like domain-containing protein [Actinomycetota bacterium]